MSDDAISGPSAIGGAIRGPSGLPDHHDSASDESTSTCPACDSEVTDRALEDDEECPECGEPTTELFLIAAGLRESGRDE